MAERFKILSDEQLIIRYRSMGDMITDIDLARKMIAKGENKTYWEIMLFIYENALDLAEFCQMNDIPYTEYDLKLIEKDNKIPYDYRLMKVIDTLREFNKQLQEHFRSHRDKKDKYNKYI